jgi:hypothetical protein
VPSQFPVFPAPADATIAYRASPLERIVNVHWGGGPIHFDGATYLDPHGFLDLPNVSTGTMSIWIHVTQPGVAYRVLAPIAGFAFGAGDGFNHGGAREGTAIGPGWGTFATGGNYDAGDAYIVAAFVTQGSGSYTTEVYHHFLMSWDSGALTAQVVTDGVLADVTIGGGGGPGENLPVPTPSWGSDPTVPGEPGNPGYPVTASQYLFCDPGGALPIIECDVFDFWFNLGTKLDLSDPAVVAKFVDTDQGTPVSLGAHGELPLTPPSVAGEPPPTPEPPHVFLSSRSISKPADFAINLGTVITTIDVVGTLTFADPKLKVSYKPPPPPPARA